MPRVDDIFDREILLERTSGKLNLIRQMTDIFARRCDTKLPEIRAAIVEERAEDVALITHSLKGSLGTLGSIRAYATAQRLEAMGFEGDLAEAHSTLQLLAEEVEEFKIALEAFVEEGGR